MKTYRRLVIALKKEYPQYKVTVRRKKLSEGYDGLTTHQGGNRFLIEISKELTEQAAIDTLVHEFGHCPAWNEYAVHSIEHGPQWGLEHSRCYRVLEKVMEDLHARSNTSQRSTGSP